MENNEISTNENTATDNSDINAQISEALNDEPETPSQDDTKETDPSVSPNPSNPPEAKDNDQFDCPEKFKNEDGSVNVENLAKSYKELEKLNSQKSEWEKERAELLKYKESVDKMNQEREQEALRAGYGSVEEMQNMYEVASMEANEFAKYLNLTEEPEVVREMLNIYSNEPTEENLEEIIKEFPQDVVRKVSIMSDRQKQQFRTQQDQIAETRKMTNIENIVSQSVDNYREYFDNEEFQNMFVSALQNGNIKTYEDAEALFNAVGAMKATFQQQQADKQTSELQNKQATDKLAAISGKTSAQNVSTGVGLTPEQLSKEISKYI